MAGVSCGTRPWWAAVWCLVVCSALLTAATLTVPAPDEPVTVRAAPGVSVRMLQMNLCGSGAAACYTGRSVREATAMVRAQEPDVITLNEVCRDDVSTLERALAEAGAGAVVSAFQAA